MILRLGACLLLILSFICSPAQSAREYFENLKDNFLAANIYVVYTGSPILDSALKHSFSKYWTIKPIKGFIKYDELKPLIRDKKNSFFYTSLYAWNVGGPGTNRTRGDRSTTAIFAFTGGKKRLSRYSLIGESASAEFFDSFCGERLLDSAVYRLPLMVAALQTDINLKYHPVSKPICDTQKILVINQALIKGKGRWAPIHADALTLWPWKYQLMPSHQIGQLIEARDKRYLVLVPTLSDQTSSIALYDLESMRVVGGSGRMNVMSLPWVRAKEIERLVKNLRTK